MASSMMMMPSSATSSAMPVSTTSGVSSSMSGMSGMDSMGSMSDMDGMACKISMTWNWYTVGACFISKTWQITSPSMFAGSCIGVIFLVISLEFLRRVQREFDRRTKRPNAPQPGHRMATGSDASDSLTGSLSGQKGPRNVASPLAQHRIATTMQANLSRRSLLVKQIIRAFIHAVQFGVAYFVMLLAMYYNGYIIICIIIGAFLGSFIFTWDQLLAEQVNAEADITGCCG